MKKDDNVAAALTATVKSLLENNDSGAEKSISTIAFELLQTDKRPSLSQKNQAEIMKRDGFMCRYCDRKTIPFPVMRVISTLYPKEFPYHPHGKSNAAHRAYWTIASSIDHVDAGTIGGSWTDSENLVTACWECNARKGNLPTAVFGLPRDIKKTSWKGLTVEYPGLWELSKQPDPKYHRPWLKAFS